MFEILEAGGQVKLQADESTLGSPADFARNRVGESLNVKVDELLQERSWSLSGLRTEIRRAPRLGLLVSLDQQVRLTWRGLQMARRLTRQHRLWELYLITHAETATSRVDRDADRIEHVLGPEIVAELESLLEQAAPGTVPASPHALGAGPVSRRTNNTD